MEGENLSDLIKKQKATYDQMKKFESNFKKSPKERLESAGHIQGRLEVLNDYWKEFRDRDSVIRRIVSDEEKENEYLTGSLYDNASELFFEYKGILNDIIIRLTSPPPSTSISENPVTANSTLTNIFGEEIRRNDSSSNNDLKLPRIVIPKFAGDYGSWLSFRDIFKSMVHSNAHIPPVQKMQYLKSCVTGEAEQLIRHLNVTEDNYAIAWDNLCKRYHNNRALVNNSLKTLFAQPHVNSENATHIRRLIDTTNECLSTLQNLKIDTVNWDPIIIFIILERLPQETKQLWEQKQGTSTSLPSLKDLTEFLEGRFRTLEALNPNMSHKGITKVPANAKTRTYHTAHFICPLCNGQHALKTCFKFLKMKVKDRAAFISSKKICSNCLAQSHNESKCASEYFCRICQGRHHSLLHPSDIPQAQVSSEATSKINPTGNVNSFFSRDNKIVLLATLLIRAISKNGESRLLRALVDPGSQATFITFKAAHSLRLKFLRASVQVSGLGNSLTASSHSSVYLNIQPHSCDNPKFGIKAIVLKTLTDSLPPQNISSSQLSHIKDLQLGDPSFERPGNIDIILGADVYAKIIEDGLIRGKSGSPTAQKTSFGWVLFGEVQSENSSSHLPHNNHSSLHNVVANFCNHVKECDALKRFWEIEEVSHVPPMSEDDVFCENLFASSHSRNPDGRYIVRLPFSKVDENELKFGDSREAAIKRYLALEKRLNLNPTLKLDYNKCLEQYLELNHMERIPKSDTIRPSDTVFYMPHHAVVKADSLTTKTRVVFDGSCKSKNGFSLNDRLLAGPTLQRDIALLITEWRQHKFVFNADITQMYRQILVHPSETDFQRIIWRSKPDSPLEDFRLLTVTFGVSSAPYLAIRSLQQLAKDEEKDYPIGAKIILNNMYVDDVLSGANTLEDAIEAKSQIDSILKRGRFELRKWSSNCEELLRDIPMDQQSSSTVLINKSDSIKTLGLQWRTGKDHFSYNFQVSQQSSVTKRSILSEIARIYDPLGWLAFIVVRFKILIQSIWQTGTDWDEPIHPDILIHWTKYLHILHHIKYISIPRYLHTGPSNHLQVHCFCDASERAYGAMLYLRVETNADIYVNLICAKTKVAPIKAISLPRLELCGAVLLAKLIKKFQNSIKSENVAYFAWTDSSIVLAWLRRHPNNFKAFVSNRITEIISSTNFVQWRHVPSQDNPADLASRGISSIGALKENLWWHGPKWLKESENDWPSNPNIPELDPSIAEFKQNKVVLHACFLKDSFEILERFSTLSRLLHFTALCQNFVKRFRKLSTESSHYSSKNIHDARMFWIKQEQSRFFSEDIDCLSKAKPFEKACKIKNLNPFLDAAGLLRVGGRLDNTALPYNEKHPLILHPDSHLTKLIINNAHVSCLHGGPSLTLTLLRKMVWIVRGYKTVKGFIRKCITCFKNSCKTQSQLMGSLPVSRIRPTRPFTNVGIDYAGPINLRISRTRGCRTYKGYIVIFICLCTKCIHIELVSDLTTDAFMATLRRFIARRGLCRNIYSDCGTTFVGARNQLDRDLIASFQTSAKEAARKLSDEAIQWHFIPPASPHFGGLWEAGVKSIKFHLKRIVGNVPLPYEDMSTLLAQIEACLNSRPLCPLTDNLDDLRILTPGHFLIGDSLLSPPEEDFSSSNLKTLSRWNLVQKLKQDFWKAWGKEYLSRLQHRPKWTKICSNLKLGDLVLLKEPNIPSNRWPLGRVIKIHAGNDGFVRVVTIKTQSGEFKRPITKVCLLPLNATSD